MGKPRVKAPKGRELVRDVLNMAPGYGYSEDSLLDGINQISRPAEAKWSEVREWVEWNHSKGYLRVEFNEDLDEDLYFITSEGIAKESVR